MLNFVNFIDIFMGKNCEYLIVLLNVLLDKYVL